MPEDQEKLVRNRCVFYSKSKRGFETVFPGMTGNGYIFFIQVNGGTGKLRGTKVYKDKVRAFQEFFYANEIKCFCKNKVGFLS